MNKLIHGPSNKNIGTLRERPDGTIDVYDAEDHFLGRSSSTGTHDAGRHLVAKERVPGLLLPKLPKNKSF